MFNSMESILQRLIKGISKLSDSDLRQLILNHERRIKELEDEQASTAPGSDPVAGVKDSKPGAAKRGRPRKSDAESAEKGGDA